MNKVIVYRSRLLPTSETFIRQQALALRKWQPILAGEQRVPDGLNLAGLSIRVLRDHKRYSLPNLHHLLSKLLWRPHAATVRQLAAIDASLVHVHFGTDAVDIWPSVRKLGLPMLVTLHGRDINIYREWWESGHGGLRRRSYPRRLLQMALAPTVHFIAVSEAIRKRAIEYGIAADKVTVSYIGVDTERFRPGGLPITKRTKRVLFVGRLVEKKGAAYLIQAFAKVRQAVAGAELVIIGDGPLRNELEQLAAGLGVPAQFLGSQSNDEVLRHMHLARVFCLPSVTAENGDAEGLPIVVLEALATGLQVITSARGAVDEAVLHMETGIAFQEGDVMNLSKHLITLLEGNELVSFLSEKARARVADHFALKSCIEDLQDTYDRVSRSKNGQDGDTNFHHQAGMTVIDKDQTRP